ncbi:REP-associated tyrosine transposase [Jeotgalibacillus campisalis]|uniref:Putative transposase n=1 Tax=Jeotgalibacillus campisalis TaxID=220754 RepID=A0A0C2V270_9BACL|nr:transposase [Jeotgalibacillus campisalis]KIL43147.1 putative transposase [Jeotgalibacillus campisalis]
MARKKRTWLPHCYYHIVSRGNRRDPLFLNPQDFEAFFHILTQLHQKYPFEIASYCLMTNHFHLLLRSLDPDCSISKIMSLVNKRYANYYNTRYRLTGHVFEKRFYDQLVEGNVGMLKVSRYIHLNPVAANMVKKCEHYPWSSYSYYKYSTMPKPDFMNTDLLLNYYAGTDRERRALYCLSVEEKGREINSAEKEEGIFFTVD